jgi:deoxycytidylate deaminase
VSDERIRRNLTFAKEAAGMSNSTQHKLGCALVYGKSIYKSSNSTKTHPTQMKHNKHRRLRGNKVFHTIHGEISVIMSVRHFNIEWGKATLFIYREFKNGNPALSRPCPACMSLIKEMGIRRIVYSDSNINGYTIEQI